MELKKCPKCKLYYDAPAAKSIVNYSTGICWLCSKSERLARHYIKKNKLDVKMTIRNQTELEIKCGSQIILATHPKTRAELIKDKNVDIEAIDKIIRRYKNEKMS